jgi:hypothetical protein
MTWSEAARSSEPAYSPSITEGREDPLREQGRQPRLQQGCSERLWSITSHRVLAA